MKDILAVLIYALPVFLLVGSSEAASAAKASITIPAVIQIESGVESVLSIEIDAAEEVPKQSWVLIRGIPSAAKLTEGRLFPSGVWAVKPAVIKKVRLITQPGTVEQAPLNVSLVALEGDQISAATARLVIGPKLAAKTPATAAIEPRSQATVSPAPPLAAERALKLMERGDRYLDEGNIASARRFYQLAADMGWPDGATAVARTYDSVYLQQYPVIGGVVANNAVAQEWYKKADELRVKLGAK